MKTESMVMWKRKLLIVSGIIALTACFITPNKRAWGREVPQVKNVILLIADGCSFEQYTLARLCKGEPLALDSILVGGVKTQIAGSVIPCSAAAATAYATGCRTNAGFISVAPRIRDKTTSTNAITKDPFTPLATVLEGARLLGKATGLVVTVSISHATPAAFAAHIHNRKMEADIMEQMIWQGIDVLLGGGACFLLPQREGGARKDQENIRDLLKARGYTVVDTDEEMKKVTSGRLFGVFADKFMEYEIDRLTFAPTQPSLAEMTRKAIDLLSADPDGFFLMVEGSLIDPSCHANDPAALLHEVLQFDAAVKVALEFAAADGNTLVMALSDHNTGGMSISAYPMIGAHLRSKRVVNPFSKMRLSTAGMWKKMGKNISRGSLQTVLKEYWGIDVPDNIATRILTLSRTYPSTPFYAIGEILCREYRIEKVNYFFVGWTTHGHTAGNVPLFAYGPGKPAGLFDAPEIGQFIAKTLGVRLDALNSRLFVDAHRAFEGYTVTLDRENPENPVLRVEYKGHTASLPINRNVLVLNGKTHNLEGVVVYAPGSDKTYIPMEAVRLIMNDKTPLPDIRR